MAKRILIMGSFDTKANELTFLRERVTELGFEAVCMDTSMGRESTVKVEIGSNEVSTAAGVPVSEIRGSSDTRWATEMMAKGGAKIVLDLRQKAAGRDSGHRRGEQHGPFHKDHGSASLRGKQSDGVFHGRRTRLRGKLFRHQGHYDDPFGGGHRGP